MKENEAKFSKKKKQKRGKSKKKIIDHLIIRTKPLRNYYSMQT